jgi:hypothetical protein
MTNHCVLQMPSQLIKVDDNIIKSYSADDTPKIANVENDIPMADDDGSITSFSDDGGEQHKDSFCLKRQAHHQLLLQSAAMRLCRRGSPPFAQVFIIKIHIKELIFSF